MPRRGCATPSRNTSEGFLIADAEDRIVVAKPAVQGSLNPWAGEALEPGGRRSRSCSAGPYASGRIVLSGPLDAAVEEARRD